MAQADVTGRRRWKMWCGAAAAVCCIVMAALGRQEAGPVVVACFLALATGTQLLLALFGLLSRYAQVRRCPWSRQRRTRALAAAAATTAAAAAR